MLNELDNYELLFEIMSEDAILESTKNEVSFIESKIVLMFEHMLKHQYQPSRQGKSWNNTIFDAHKEIIKSGSISKSNVLNGIDLDKCYKEARNKAAKATNVNSIPKQKPLEWDINFITNLNSIYEYLKYYYNPNATYNVDLDEFFKEKQNK